MSKFIKSQATTLPRSLQFVFSIGFALIFSLLAGCQSGPRQVEASIENITRPDSSTGVVVAKVCYGQGILVGKVGTKEEITHIGGNTAFALRLSPGRYEIKEISSGIGPYYPVSEPLTFEVMPQRTIYIGTIKASWQYGDKYAQECRAEGNQFFAERDYKRGGIGKSVATPVRVINDFPHALPSLKLRYPNYGFDQVESKPMQ
jgi:hypothetical protein